MKEIGYSENGGRIVEMTRGEYEEFSLLCRAVEGRSSLSVFSETSRISDGFDFSNTFGVIRAFYASLFRINELQILVDAIREGVNKK